MSLKPLERLTRAEIIVTGDVHRVGYRNIAQDNARKLGVKGYVQNMPDGTVKIVAEAPEETINRYVETLTVREPPINVEKIQVTHAPPTGEHQYFTIKYGDLAEEMTEGFGTGLKYINLSRQENREGFQTLRSEMKEGFQTLGGETKAMRDDMNKNFQNMSERYDDISQNLGQAVKIIQEESTKTRAEMTRAVDNLSKLVEEFLKSRRGEPQKFEDQ